MDHPEAPTQAGAVFQWRLGLHFPAWAALVLVNLTGFLTCWAAPLEADVLWVREVEPLLDRYCFKCHGGVRQKSGLDLRSLENILKGGENGPAIDPGNPAGSHLYQFVLKGGEPHMPQDERKQLKEQDISVLQAWISALPATNIVVEVITNSALWADAYVKAYQGMHQPEWTPPSDMSPHQVIDHFVKLEWERRKLASSELCEDGAFARRLYLDLAGRIPNSVELKAFVNDPQPGKRARLADDLLAGPDYPRHMREVFDVVLMERRDATVEQQRRDHEWFTFLENGFQENRPWDQIVRQLILARPVNSKERGAIWFLYEKQNKPQAMAEALAPIAFGVQINCAQCHNHPLAAEIEQRHYWGLVAAFNRSKNVESMAGAGVAESAIGGFINFSNLKKESQPAQLAFLNGTIVSEQRPSDSEKEADSPDRYLVPPPLEKEKPAQPAVPKFSRRIALADAVTHNNPQLALAFANRIWALLLGRGLVHPTDQMDSRHHPSHPDLLAWLGRDFEEHGYDIKRLIREIVLSHTYQLDSRPLSSTRPPPDAFACALEKPLSAEQLFRSFLVATGNAVDAGGKVAGLAETDARRGFIAQFPDLFPVEYNASLQQATFLSNSAIIDQLLQPQDGNTIARLLNQPPTEDRIQLAFALVLGRKPDADEMSHCAQFLGSARDAGGGARQLVWALLAGPEFQLNH